MDDEEILSILGKLYTRKRNGWFVTGYRCPFCKKHYHTLRKELYNHVRLCEGPKDKKTYYTDED